MLAVAGADDLLYLFRYAGRLAFPFSPFSWPRAACTPMIRPLPLRLGALARLSVVPFTATGGRGSVIATFFFAALGFGFERLLQSGPAVSAIPLFAACALALLLNVDYGFPAVPAVSPFTSAVISRRKCRTGWLSSICSYQPLSGPPLHCSGRTDGGLSAPCPSPVLLPYALRRASSFAAFWLQWRPQSQWFFYGSIPSIGSPALWAWGCAELRYQQ